MIVRLASVLLVSGLLVLPVAAEQKPKTAPAPEKSADTPSNARTQPAPSAAAPDARIPEARGLSILIRRTLLTLNDANLTGNYTVLRDLAAPGFQSANNAAKLSEIFASLRNHNIDLAPIMYFEPKLVRQPEITTIGMLRVSGFIPTRPQQVNFDMLFQKVADKWRLFGIAVNTTAAQPEAASLTPALPPAAGATPAKAGASDKK